MAKRAVTLCPTLARRRVVGQRHHFIMNGVQARIPEDIIAFWDAKGKVFMFSVSEEALEQIKKKLAEVQRPELALRAEIVGRSEEDFHYRLSFVPEEMKHNDDLEFDVNGLSVFVDPVSARYRR